VALAPKALDEEAAPAPASTPPPDALAAAFAGAARGLDAGEPGALGKLRAVAEAGYAPAQFYLSKLYEGGQRGVKQDMVQARAWTQKAADGGDGAAMHNLALYEFRGEGGRQDLAGAARWFRAAAEQGIVDSQYNLGLLYQSGSGVPADPALAFAWFSIAASGGDAQARANAAKLAAQLSPEQFAQAREVIAGHGARRPAAESLAVTGAEAQRILGRLGYYGEQVSNDPGEQLRTALAAFQRDNRLPATGRLDAGTARKLAAFAL
jgi:localization factor PodJL